MEIERISPEKKAEIHKLRKFMFEKFRAVPEEGKLVEYMGKSFIVYPTVFWPHDDSIALVENCKINRGDKVLDLCTGSGNIAIMSAYNGAKRVVAIDINPNAVKAAKENVKSHGFEGVVEVRSSDMFENILEDEKFDVITANMPFEGHPAEDGAENNVYDPDFHANREFFEKIGKHLNSDGRVYISQSNFGDIDEVIKLAEEKGFSIKLIGKRDMNDGLRIFYAFELRRKND